MEILMKQRRRGKCVEFTFTLPTDGVDEFKRLLCDALAKIGIELHDENDDESIPAEEVFPEGFPGMALRGLRGKEDLTQEELAERIGVTPNRVSEMESGKRSISREMTKRIGKEFNISYKVFI
jgi:DNA-binding XRE family transcriptional regulator